MYQLSSEKTSYQIFYTCFGTQKHILMPYLKHLILKYHRLKSLFWCFVPNFHLKKCVVNTKSFYICLVIRNHILMSYLNYLILKYHIFIFYFKYFLLNFIRKNTCELRKCMNIFGVNHWLNKKKIRYDKE